MTTPKSNSRAADSTGKARSLMIGGLLGAGQTAAFQELRHTLSGRARWAFAAAAVSLATWTGTLRAGTIYVPNASFELPVVSYEEIASTNMISWETFPPQADGAIGAFVNNPAYANDVPDDYIYNCDGTQAAFIFNDPGLALFQDYDAVDSTGAASHAFSATFEAGKFYRLLAGIIVSTNFYGTPPGSTLQMSLYYRDSSSNMVTIAATNIVYDTSIFTSITNFVTFELDSPPVQASDPWAGQHIGIQFLSTYSPDPGQDIGTWAMCNCPRQSMFPTRPLSCRLFRTRTLRPRI